MENVIFLNQLVESDIVVVLNQLKEILKMYKSVEIKLEIWQKVEKMHDKLNASTK